MTESELFKMKRIKIVFLSLISITLLTSCATTTVESQSKTTSNHKTPSREIETKKETAEDLFIKSLEGITITNVSSPKEITKGRSFSKPFVFSAKKADGSAAEGFALTLEYPVSKSMGHIQMDGKIIIFPSKICCLSFCSSPCFKKISVLITGHVFLFSDPSSKINGIV